MQTRMNKEQFVTQDDHDLYDGLCHWKHIPELGGRVLVEADFLNLYTGIFSYTFSRFHTPYFFPDRRAVFPCVVISTPHTLHHLLPMSIDHINGFVERLYDMEPDHRAIVVGGGSRRGQDVLKKVLSTMASTFDVQTHPDLTGAPVALRVIHLSSMIGVIKVVGDEMSDVMYYKIAF